MVMVFTLVSAVQEKLLEYEKVANDEVEKEKREKEEQNKKREEVGSHLIMMVGGGKCIGI